MIQAHFTFAYAAVLALLYVGLSIRVVAHRFKTKVLLGDGAHHGLNVAIRTHANFSEYVPLALILIFGVEVLNYPTFYVHVLGGILIFARLAHVHGVAAKQTTGAGRSIGTILTLSVILGSSILILLKM